MRRKLKYRPRKVILKGIYYCPVVPELGHYDNEGLWGYDKLVHVERSIYKVVQCLFKTEEERDAAYKKEYCDIRNLGELMLKRRKGYHENELDDLEQQCLKTEGAYKIIEGKNIRLTV